MERQDEPAPQPFPDREKAKAERNDHVFERLIV
jgi:hypothetical protein